MYILAPFVFVLSHEGVGTHEVTAPIGWDDMQLTIARDAVYHGIGARYTLDFSFVKDGREFLQTVYNQYGIEGVVLLTIYEADYEAGRHISSYLGRINMSDLNTTELDATANAEETGFVRALINLEDVEVDLTKLESLSGAALQRFTEEATPIELHSKAIVKRYMGLVTNTAPAWNYRPVSYSSERAGNLYIGFDDVKFNEFEAYTYPTGLSFGEDTNDPKELIEFFEAGAIRIELTVDVLVECFVTRGDFDEAELFFWVGINGRRDRVYYWDSRTAMRGRPIDGPLKQTIRFNYAKTLQVEAGDKLYVYGRAQIGDVTEPLVGRYEFEWQITPRPACSLSISGATTTKPSTAWGFMLHELFARLVGSLTGRNQSFYSELLGRVDSSPTTYAQDGEMAKLMVLNGSAIRGFPLSERPIFAALKDVFTALNALRPVGLASEKMEDGGERVRLEGVEWFYRPEVVLELGVVSDLKRSVAQEYYANEVEVGFSKWESGEDNSLDEVNTKQTRTTAVTQLKGKYTAVSPYPSSGYLIENVRRLQFAKTPSKEDGNDKTNFWICVVRSSSGGFETERNQNMIMARNVLSPETMYNVRITPMRNFLRHGRLIRSGLYKMEKRPVKFAQGNANYAFESQLVAEVKPVVESGYITGEELPAPLWIPEYYTFTTPLPVHQRKKLEQNPYGIITFRDSLGNLKKGFLKDAKVKITDSEADFKLLRYNE